MKFPPPAIGKNKKLRPRRHRIGGVDDNDVMITELLDVLAGDGRTTPDDKTSLAFPFRRGTPDLAHAPSRLYSLIKSVTAGGIASLTPPLVPTQ